MVKKAFSKQERKLHRAVRASERRLGFVRGHSDSDPDSEEDMLCHRWCLLDLDVRLVFVDNVFLLVKFQSLGLGGTEVSDYGPHRYQLTFV